MLLTEVRVLLHNSAGTCNYSLNNLNQLLKSQQISKQFQQCLKNGSHYSAIAVLVQGKVCQSPRRNGLIYGTAYHVRRKHGIQVNSLEIIKAGEPRAFSTTSGALSPPDDKGKKTGSSKALSRQEGRGDGQVTLSVGEKVKEDAKTATYGGVILLGIAVTCAMGYFILSELFSDDSPNNIYTKSFKLCKANQDVQDTLGGPIKCYGEETRRGWRRHVAHQQFLHGETKILRMRFYLEGKFNKATVHVEKKGNVNGKYEYSYLVVDVDGYPPRRITIDT